jgi:hypothetical protein
MGSRDDVLLGGGTGGTTSSPVTFPVPSQLSDIYSNLHGW